jgi:hypothetical protein
MANSTEEMGTSVPRRVLVIGDSGMCSQHVTSWKLSGVEAEKISRKKLASLSGEGNVLDVCASDFSERVQLIESAIRSELPVVIIGPISDHVDTVRRLIKKKAENKPIILNPIKSHPLVTKTIDLISQGRIGKPVILKLEVLNFDRKLSEYAVYSGLLNSISIMKVFFLHSKPLRIFSKLVTTDYSKFYVALIALSNGQTCELVAGASSESGKLEFSLNGRGGMISFLESKTLEYDSKAYHSDTMATVSSIDVLSKVFGDYIRTGRGDEGETLDEYLIAKSVIHSARKTRPIVTD